MDDIAETTLLPSLSPFERDVYELRRRKKTRRDIADLLRRPLKSVDGALQRIADKSADIRGGVR